MEQNKKMDKSQIEEIMALTPMQEGMLFHYLKEPEDDQYFEQLSLRILGTIDTEVFKKSWELITSRNEMLRTFFRWEKIQNPVQIVLKNYKAEVKFYDFSKDNSSLGVYNLQELKKKDKNKKFDLRQVPFRITLCRMGEQEYEMLISNHHILFDGWSTGIILKEFFDIYETLSNNKALELPTKTKFKEFIKYINNKNSLLEEEYWKEYLKGYEEVHIVNEKTKENCIKIMEQYSFSTNDSIKKEIDLFIKTKRITLAGLIYSTWGILLQKYTNSSDVIFGTTLSGRNPRIKGIEDMVGLFINTLPIRIKNTAHANILDLLYKVKSQSEKREEFQNTALMDIKKYLSLTGMFYLFDSLVVVENYPIEDFLNKKGSSLTLSSYHIEEETNYPIMLSVNSSEVLTFTLTYNKAYFRAEEITAMADCFMRILNHIVYHSEDFVDNIEILSDLERKKIVQEFNDNHRDYPRNKTLHQLLEEQVERTPNNIAVVFEEKKLTYRQLNEKANRLARTLREKGVKPDSIVGIMVERSLEMIVGIMGILKAGGAYLPIDPEYPEHRIKYMLEDSKTKILLTQGMLSNKSVFEGIIIDLDEEKEYADNTEDLENRNLEHDLAYVIYTSGSTGKPKGVMIEHGSVINTLCSLQEYYPLLQEDSYLLKTNYTFDVSVSEIFTWILCGSKLVIIPKGEEKEVKQIIKAINKNKVTHINFTPSMLKAFVNLIEEKNKEELKSLKYIFSAGEAIQKETVKVTKEKLSFVQLENLYGPTEATVYATKYSINNLDSEVIPIGKPINNTKCFILDGKNSAVPIGVVGELFLGGAGLARGYLNKSELTLEKFIENPFDLGTLMYRTGDLARWLPDGNIEFLGRIDHQVKIRGFRIELGEIENQLLNYKAIKEAVVIDREDKEGDKYLCAYIVCNTKVIVSELRQHLLKNLPEYMVPSYFIPLEKMPLNSNGKIDRRALPEPYGSLAVGTEYEGARNEVEEKLIKIWIEVLSVENIGISHNFFDLGGHSLKATTLVSKIHKELNVQVPLKVIFKVPTIKGISEYIRNTEKSIFQEIKLVEEKEYYEVSSAQKRMYMLQQFNLENTSYNMPGVLEVQGNLDIETLEKAFSKLIERHETLRTSFENIEGEIVQRVSNNIDFKVDYVNIEETTLDRENLIDNFVRAFDLSKAPLLRVGIIRTEKARHTILFDMHHIISDGVSMGILTKEFVKLYDGKALEKINVQYKDFSAWQNSLLKSEKMKAQEEYWLQRFSDDIPVLNMPIDFIRPAVQSFEGNSLSLKLDKELTKDLNKVAKETESTMYMVLLSAVNLLLSQYSGQEDIVIGSPIAGRTHADLEKIIGAFVNTLPMRNYPEGNKNYEEFLKEVKETALRAYENQDYQFEELVEKLNIRRDISRNPLFDVMFTMQNMDSSEIELKDLKFVQCKNKNKVAKFDLNFTAAEVGEGIVIDIGYATKLFAIDTVERIAQHFKEILNAITKNTKIKLNEIEMLSEKEKIKLLYEFNNTYTDYPKDKTIKQLFQEQVENTPDNVALVDEDKSFTYKELNEKSNSLARILVNKGAKPGAVVGIVVERCVETIVGIIAIIKTGAAYMPIDSDYPLDRVKYMIEDSNAKILLAEKDIINFSELNIDALDLNSKELYMEDISNTEFNGTIYEPIYLIYTSGTTGLSKGVMVSNINLVNYTNWIKNKLNLNEKDKTAIVSSLAFDLSYTGFYSAILSGCEIHIIKKELYLNPEFLLDYININNITYLKLTPSLFSVLNNSSKLLNKDYLNSMRYLVLGGEKINIQEVQKFHDKYPHISIMNHYGPTETTIGSISEIIDFTKLQEEKHRCCIGYPIDNTKVYILDKQDNLSPIGVFGEICIAGDGVSKGYINNSELTYEKFIWKQIRNGIEERIYRTGDYGRRLSNGKIEFLGRIDNQIKVRGFRVELKEIESRIIENEFIKETVVIPREDKEGDKHLCAYLVCHKEVAVSELRKQLLKKLPEYMVPSYFVQLEKMPLTNNGKLDMKALPQPDGNIATGTEYERPRNKNEEILVEIWGEVLSVENIGINHDFFHLGGHSLKATSLVSKIHKELNVEVPIKEIFQCPTIKGISEYIESIEKNIYEEIKVVDEKEHYEVSSAQKRMYMLQQFDLQSTSYNMPAVLEVEGSLQLERLENAFYKLIERHQTLRTSFKNINGQVLQSVSSNIQVKLDYVDISKAIKALGQNGESSIGHNELIDLTIKEQVDNLIKSFIKAFDLSKAPLLRMGVIKVNREKHILMFDMHHIISDGVSMGILTKEFAKLYDGKELEKIRVQYKDFSAWQNNFLKSEKMKKQEEYWLQNFSGEIPVLNMPMDFTRPSMQNFQGDSINLKLDKDITRGLNKVAKETGSTMFMVLLSGINILLSKYSGQEDLIVGSTIAGRPHADLEKIIGMFVNALAMRNHPEESKNYKDFLKEVKENALKAYENQDYQFEELVEKLNIRRDISRNPLFDVMFTMQNMDNAELQLKDLKFKKYKNNNKVAKFDLTFFAVETSEEISIDIDYCTELFKSETMERMVEHFRNILKLISRNPEVKISELDMLSESERRKLLVEFNDTYRDYPRNKTIHQIFEQRVEEIPNNIALVFQDKQLTYRELNEKSNRLAKTLREKGIKGDSKVGIMLERSLEMLVGVMGILKAGGAFLPVAPEYPEDRIIHMLEDSEVKILLTQTELTHKVQFNGEIINLEEEEAYSDNTENLEHINSSKDLVYVLYTSGSTGKPKGAMIEHQGLINTLMVLQENCPVSHKDSYLLKTNCVFDVSVIELFTWFFGSGKLIILPNGLEKEPLSIAKTIQKNKVTHINFTPSMVSVFFNSLSEEYTEIISSLKYIILGGEAVQKENIEKIRRILKDVNIENIYGPTEFSIFVTRYSIKELKNNIPIGPPVNNTKCYILGKNKNLQPVGVVGELCLAGDGESRGYVNRPELTAEKFVSDPFNPGKLMYRTGDLARWLPDGNIEFLGRIDHQVKIRGFRIELGEIENVLLNYESVKEVVVMDRKDRDGDKYLCAYITCHVEVKVSELRKHLLKNLPEYMVPAYFIQLESMPLTSNGKVDRRSLPEPDISLVAVAEYEGARNEVEEKLIEIWSEVLAVESIGINHNFFDMGGHSLKATALISIIHRELKVQVPLKEIFKSPTIKGISEYIQNAQKNVYEDIKVVEEQEYYEVSSAQKRMYMLQQFDLQSTNYNMPGILEVEGKLDVHRLETAFNKLIKRHETLRTSFINIEEKIVQKVSCDIDFKIGYTDIEKTMAEAALDKEILKLDSYVQEKAIKEENKKLISNFVRAFDLGKAPLLRVEAIKVSDEKHILMFDMHHIISDGVSMAILTKEFANLYDGKDLEKIKVQYKDFSAWQNNLLKSDKMKKQEEYWLQTFSSEIPTLNMPLDFARPSVQSFEGDSINLTLDTELTNDLNKIAKEIGSTMYMVLLSGVNILLSKYSGQEDIVIGSAIAGRPHADLEKIIGMFVNTLAMRNYPEGSKTYVDFLKEVKENALKSFENQEYQFEELIEKLNLRRDISRNPLFDVMFTMQNMDSTAMELKELKLIPYKNNNKISKFDLTITGTEIGEEILLDINYCTKLFKRETVERIAEHFKNILKVIVKNSSIKLSEIDMLLEDEKYKLLYEFNDTYADYPRHKTIHQLFEEQVEKTPDKVAVEFDEEKLTYRQLNEKSNRLARTLRVKGVKKDSIVGIMVNRSLEMIVGIMGILKAGGAYLPIDPEYPEERVKYILEDSRAEILLTMKDYYNKAEFNGEKLNLEEEGCYLDNATNLKSTSTIKDLVYVIYTSGSTGNPKGVMIENQSLINFLYSTIDKFDNKFGSDDKCLSLTNYVFDVSVFEIFISLIKGLTLVINNKHKTFEVNEITQLIIKKEITLMYIPPSLLLDIYESLKRSEKIIKLNKLLVGVEPIKVDILKKYLSLNLDIQIINAYGPTEATICSTFYKIHGKEEMNIVPIGNAIMNTKVYILNQYKLLQPIGIVGEIYVSGKGIARGYLNKPELTAEKFVENTFIAGEKMYKTGDLARWLPDGNIEFIGRIDHQVKIRGFRIELGEIENQLLSYELIKQVAVIDRKDKNGDKYLCAYLVCKEEVMVSELRKHLLNTLPEYMVPAQFIQLEKIPLNANGKVDKKALPESYGNLLRGTEYEGARTETEEKLLDLWSEVLGVEKIGIHDNFFELGGHSLKAIQLTSLLHKNLNVKIALQDLFNAPTVELLSEVISNRAVSIYKDIRSLPVQNHYELSYTQKRLWIIYKTNPHSTAYNMPGNVTLYEKVDEKILKRVFSELIHRHEGLRTRFKVIEGEPVQIVEEVDNFNLEISDISSLHPLELVETRNEIYNELVSRIFDLEVAPIIYVKLVKISDEEYDLIYCMHHIISDGFSIEILKNEFNNLYNAYKKEEKCKLAPLNIQYKDFAAWQNELIKDKERIEAAKGFWNNQLSRELTILQLPYSYPNTNITNRDSAGYRIVLSENQKHKLKALEKEYNTSLFVVLVTSFNLFLAKLTNQKDILIGTAGFGRNHDDLKNIIGCFVNTTILRNEISIEESFAQLLGKINKNTLKALEYQNYPIELMLDELNISYPKISAFFNMLNMGDSNKKYIEDFSEYNINKMQSVKFDMAWYITEYANGIQIVCSYLLALFEPSRMEYIMGMYVKILDYALENPNKMLKDYKLNESKRKFKKS